MVFSVDSSTIDSATEKKIKGMSPRPAATFRGHLCSMSAISELVRSGGKYAYTVILCLSVVQISQQVGKHASARGKERLLHNNVK